MDWFLYIYFLLLCLSSTTVPGTSVTLECLASGYDINQHHIHWTTQPTETGLVYTGAFRTGYTTYTANEFKGRVTPSTHGSTAQLRIDALKVEDTATYYCLKTQWLTSLYPTKSKIVLELPRYR
uniref:Ig-like domain-containing protein n=1 Tax=Naja naja TaxID=35670 RepID=A0A8C6X517_NAJNA